MGVETAVLAAGVGIQAYSQYQQGQARASAARQEAKFKRAQAAEMLDRMAIEEVNLKEQGEQFKAEQTAGYAAGGVALGTGATLLALEDTNSKITKKVSDMKRDTTFRANQLMMGANVSMQEASAFSSAGTLSAVGTLLEGGASYYKNRSSASSSSPRVDRAGGTTQYSQDYLAGNTGGY